MKIVGDRLANWAANPKTDSVSVDLFGRSAINRFYYAAYLITREMLGSFDVEWKHTSHKNIPELLDGQVKKFVLNQLVIDVKRGLISQAQRSSIETSIKRATSELSTLLKEAYNLRVVADYEPKTLIIVNNQILKLENCTLSSASKWPDRAHCYCKAIRRAWGEVGLA